MALNLSTLTSPATSGDVLAEALTTADFLEGVPVLRNLARGSQKGGDAKQDVALNQPKALPLDANGKGYCYLPVTTGNAPAVTFPTIGSSDDFVLEMDVYLVNAAEFHIASAPTTASRFLVSGGAFYHGSTNTSLTSSLSTGVSTLKIERASGTITLKQNDQLKASASFSSSVALTFLSHNGQFVSSVAPLNGYIQKATLSIEGTEELNIDFTATNVRHGDTKIKCATGQVVTINQSGNDPATIIKKPVLRFITAAGSSLRGQLNRTITDGGYYFAAFTINGDGGNTASRVFAINSTGQNETANTGFVYAIKKGATNDLASYHIADYTLPHDDLYDDARGDILHQVKTLNNAQLSAVNGAAAITSSVSTSNLSAEEFGICCENNNSQSSNPSLDLEYLALFPATITDAQADSVRNYINNRNTVFLRHDTDGYYFFDAQKAPAVPITSGSSSWNGRIVGSDFGDTDRYLTQGTSNDAPVGDGYVVTFADNTDHLEIPQVTQAGWQVVGTSLGTFAYRVDNDAVTELNLLGNLGQTDYRKAGDLYGIILLPESATGREIEQARKLLIDRGAADGTTSGTIFTNWYNRDDIVEFKHINTSSVTYASYAWYSCQALEKFPALDLSNSNNFTASWYNCDALTSFPAGAKLGTEANNVNFSQAWRSSGLTSFPALDLSNATSLYSTWRDCDDMLSFGLVNTSSVTNFSDTWLGCNSLTSFPLIDTSSGTRFYRTWYDLDSITDFPLLNVSAGRYFSEGWRFCAELVNFPAGLFNSWNPASITSGVFDFAWTGCTSLTAQSVENILTSIDASGKYATTTGASGGSALADAGIDIDYDGTTLSAATNAAIDSLSGKGWEVYINGVLVIPNILDLAPAAAYSLRSFDADADPNVVNVRRSSDSALRDFTASEVSDGTLTTWVNTEYETVINGEFTTDSDWSKGSGWDIANGKATSDGTQTGVSFLNQASNMGASQSQRVTLVVSDYTAGTVRVRLGVSAPNSSITSQVSSNGTHVFTLPSHSNPSVLFIEASADFQGSIESISVIQLTADGHVTTWYDQGGTNHATQSTASAQPKIVDGGTLVTEGGLAALDFPTEVSNLDITHSDLYGQATLDSYYVTNATGDAYIYPSLRTISTVFGMTAASSSSTNISASYGSPDFYGNGTQITGTTRTEIRTATSGGQKLVSHIGANTESSNWSNYNMNFGNYFNADSYSYTGKLQEMIFFNTDQSANRTGIENNINSHFTIYS